MIYKRRICFKSAFNKQLLPNEYPVDFKIIDDNKKTMLPVIANCPSTHAQAEFVVREILNIKELNKQCFNSGFVSFKAFIAKYWAGS